MAPRIRAERRALLTVAACAALFSPAPARAEWGVWPIVTVGVTRTDNVNLGPRGEELNETILEVAPGLALESEAERHDVNLRYGVQGVFYDAHGDADQVFHQADLTAGYTLVPQRLFLESSASYGQQLVNPEQDFLFNNLSINENRTDVGQYRLGPRLQLPVGLGLRLDAAAYRGKVNYDDPTLLDSTTDEGRLTFGSSTFGAGFSWQVSYDVERLEYVGAPRLEYQQAAFRARVGSQALAATLLVGMESDYELPTQGRLEEGLWELGFSWAASNHALDVSRGQRSFGRIYRARYAVAGERVAASFGYTQEPSSPARVQLGGSMLSQDVLDSLLVRPGSAERFVRKLLTAEVTHPFADGSFTASLGREEHEQRQLLVPSDDPDGPEAGNLRDDTSNSLRLLWTRELSLRTAVVVDFGLGRRRLGGQPDEEQIHQLAASLLYRPGRRTTVFFRLARAEERSARGSDADDYRENAFSIYVSWSTRPGAASLGTGRPVTSFSN